MCPLRLPNEATSYRPCGMLDRDQRTAFTISKKCRGPSIILTTTTTLSSCITSADSTSELIYNKSPNQKCNNTSVKCKSMPPTVDMPTTEKDLSGCECDCQQFNNSAALNLWKENTSMASRRKHPTASGYYQSRTKLVNCLLVSVCIWFIAIHQTCAYPILQMDTQSENRHSDALTCELIRDTVNQNLQLSLKSSTYLGNMLSNYTQIHFNKEPKDVHKTWEHQPAHFNYNLDIPNPLPLDYNTKLTKADFPHLIVEGPPSQQELEREMQRIFSLLHSLNKVLTEIKEDYEKNEVSISNYLNSASNFNESKHLFEEQLRYNSEDMHELSLAMDTLRIQKPQLQQVVVENLERFNGQWIATREHLKVHQYMQAIYKIFMDRCS